jgi:hypothetical protein
MDNDPFASRVILITWTENSDLLASLKHKAAPNLQWTKPKSGGHLLVGLICSVSRKLALVIFVIYMVSMCFFHSNATHLCSLSLKCGHDSTSICEKICRYAHTWFIKMWMELRTGASVGISWVLWIRSWPRRDQTTNRLPGPSRSCA